MSDTNLPPPKGQSQPSGAGSLSVATAAVIVISAVLKARYDYDMSADLAMATGVLVTAGAHGAQHIFLAWSGWKS